MLPQDNTEPWIKKRNILVTSYLLEIYWGEKFIANTTCQISFAVQNYLFFIGYRYFPRSFTVSRKFLAVSHQICFKKWNTKFNQLCKCYGFFCFSSCSRPWKSKKTLNLFYKKAYILYREWFFPPKPSSTR